MTSARRLHPNRSHRAPRLAASAMAIVLLVASVTPSSAQGRVESPFWDVAVTSKFFDAIYWASTNGIASGYADGGFHPTDAVTRQAMAAFLYNMEGQPAGPYLDPNFTDVSPSHPFFLQISWLVDQGIAAGYADGGFHPTDPVTRQAMASFLYKVDTQPAPPFPDPEVNDVTSANPFWDPISWLISEGVATGYADGGYHPSDVVSRQAMASFLFRYDFRFNDLTRFPVTTKVSVSSGGTEGNDHSTHVAMSGDGRFVAFASSATNLVGGDTNARTDVFLRDTFAGTTRRVSISDGEAQSNGTSGRPAVSDDGNLVFFASSATNLVAGDVNGFTDIFMRDIGAGTTSLITRDTGTGPANGNSTNPTVTPNGQFVAFETGASDLIADDTNGVTDIYRFNRVGGAMERVSLTDTEGESDGPSTNPSMSDDTTIVAFESRATNLTSDTPADNAAKGAIFVRNRGSSTTSLVSKATDGTVGNGASQRARVSSTGRYVSFTSTSDNVVAGDTNGVGDVFIRDRSFNVTTRVSVASDGSQATVSAGGSPRGSFGQSMSDNGRYVVFVSDAVNLPVDTPDPSLPDTNGLFDVFVRDRTNGETRRLSVGTEAPFGVQANGGSYGSDPDTQSNWTAISGSGLFVVYRAAATNLASGPANGRFHIYRTRSTL